MMAVVHGAATGSEANASPVSLLARILLALIRVYQLTLSRLVGQACRFEPTCSRYTATCISRFGALRGSWLGTKRICRCHPFCPGGFDPPPEAQP